jgi:hypothetical protein
VIEIEIAGEKETQSHIMISAISRLIIDMIDVTVFASRLPNGTAANATFIGKPVVTKE